MIRRILWLLATLLLAHVQLAEAQQIKKVPRIGFMSGSGHPAAFDALRHEVLRIWKTPSERHAMGMQRL